MERPVKTVSQHCQKFQQLLRELFQFNCSDLDFGIYRIMNHKRGVVEKFIAEDLPEAVSEEVSRAELENQSRISKELAEVAQQIEETLGGDALDVNGDLARIYHDIPLGRSYQELKRKASGNRDSKTLEISVFNHLYAFFNRYYQDGDFISKRRFSKHRRYAIPYNGEEVYLYWANSDQYYIKTAEHFRDYTFTSSDVTVHFKLRAANVEQDNVRGDKRFFLPSMKEIACDEEAKQVIIPFEYRPMTRQEGVTYGRRNQQDEIINEILEEIPERLKTDWALAALIKERHQTSDGQFVSFLEHHLRQYTRRNTSDFFIHKDLKNFLSRELDFYLKNEVLNLEEMETAGENCAESWFQLLRVTKSIGGRIIDFLDQIERFQKMLWEKRKFITETQYCVTVGNIDESFYHDIAGCEPQWKEWGNLLSIAGEKNKLFDLNKGGGWR